MIINNLIIGGMQSHQSIKHDGISTCLTSSMGTGGGYVPMIILKENKNELQNKETNT